MIFSSARVTRAAKLFSGGAILVRARFHAYADEQSVEHTEFAQCIFEAGRLNGALFRNCTFFQCSFPCELLACKFIDCKFINCNFFSTTVKWCDFAGSAFSKCKFEFALLFDNSAIVVKDCKFVLSRIFESDVILVDGLSSFELISFESPYQ